ncbi:MAG: FAD/NAD(P)-binding protein [Candidatus Natronoplasma sp.]
MSEDRSIYLPEKATIKNIKQMTEREKLFEVELDNGETLGHDPGQFVELSIPGVGEAPISISSSPTKEGTSFELCVRAVGNVTNVLHGMEVGDKIGIRGPFGNGFPVDELKGQDVLFIAGGLGIAPLRSLINYSLDRREEFEDVKILYGCREPCELLYEDEVEQWRERDDIDYHETVDKCPEGVCWEGNVGVITTLIPGVDLDLSKTRSVVCGPPIMYRFVLQELDKKELPDEQIYISLERRMKCGVGKCGHCQIAGAEDEFYVCQDGPVFNYEVIKGFEEAL